MDLYQYFEKYRKQIDDYLDRYLIKKNVYPKSLHEGMRYAIFSGGKRIRPILTIAAAQAVGGRIVPAMPVACAIECVHAYSLVHDDLPCMDNDDYRRGKQTVHKKFGEWTAVLVGDALLTFAFDLITKVKPAEESVQISKILAQAAGARGMIGGQMVDKLYERKRLTLPVMDFININKTGKLLAASCHTGAIVGGASKAKEKIILKYGEHLGLVFQLIDDIIDNDGYVRFAGRSDCLRRAEDLTNAAKSLAAKLPKNQKVLIEIADFVLKRKK